MTHFIFSLYFCPQLVVFKMIFHLRHEPKCCFAFIQRALSSRQSSANSSLFVSTDKQADVCDKAGRVSFFLFGGKMRSANVDFL